MQVFRLPWALSTAIISSLFVHFASNFLLKQQPRLPVGTAISAFSIFLLLQSRSLFAYGIAGVSAELSKWLLPSKTGHIFNPSGFGLLVALVLTPRSGAVMPGQWHSSSQMIVVFLVVGFGVATLARRQALAGFYVLGFLSVALFRSLVTQSHWQLYAGTVIGIPQIIFACHMLTDPKTSPSRFYQQILFGLSIGAVDEILRWNRILNPGLWALLICSALFHLLNDQWLSVESRAIDGAA